MILTLIQLLLVEVLSKKALYHLVQNRYNSQATIKMAEKFHGKNNNQAKLDNVKIKSFQVHLKIMENIKETAQF